MKANFENLNIDIYGESHSEKIGVVLGGIPKGETLSLNDAFRLVERRKSGRHVWDTPRKEDDAPWLLRGLKYVGKATQSQFYIDKTDFKTTEYDVIGNFPLVPFDEKCYEVDGDIEVVFYNNNVKKHDYNQDVPRPSHADYAAYMKDGIIRSGGGRFSGRMTLPLCFAGGVALELLKSRGVEIASYLAEIGGVSLGSYLDDTDVSLYGISDKLKNEIYSREIPCLDGKNLPVAISGLEEARNRGDSLGGVAECVISGVHAGRLGDALFDGLEGKLAYALYAIPAVKGVEFGRGFAISKMTGSAANDELAYDGGKIVTASNNNGGVTGGISNGMPILFRVAIKPTPSIALPQNSVDLRTGENASLTVKGRHDACIATRVAPIIEAAAALALYDEFLRVDHENE